MVGRRTIVMCINVLSVLQWRDQFLRWTALRPEQVTICTKDIKQIPGDVFITTYSMLTAKQPDAPGTTTGTATTGSGSGPLLVGAPVAESDNARLKRQIFAEIEGTAWGMLVLDEVHVAPANCFQTVVDRVKHHCILGLTATLLREDMKVDDLRYLVGPKLYEANWLELTRAGHLAPATCVEVRCPLPATLLRAYLEAKMATGPRKQQQPTSGKGSNNNTKVKGKQTKKNVQDEDVSGADSGPSARRLLTDIECINPYKLWCTQALVAFHESRSPPDKTIIFCDSCPAAHFYARRLGIPFMDGDTSDTERSTLLKHFQFSQHVHTIILSRVGDIALDLPEATVVIQISGLFSSKRQEAQRLGRILRPKPPSLDHGMSYFYALVSQDTAEMRHAANRQSWLRDQGYAYGVVHSSLILDYYSRHQNTNSSSRIQASPSNISSVPRPLACIGAPRWYYAVPLIVSIEAAAATSTAAPPAVAKLRAGGAKKGAVVADDADVSAAAAEDASQGGKKRVLKLTGGKRARDSDDNSSTNANNIDNGRDTTADTAGPPPWPLATSVLRYCVRMLWVPFSGANAAALEGAFLAGHHNADPRLHIHNSGKDRGEMLRRGGPPPLLLPAPERLPLAHLRILVQHEPQTSNVSSTTIEGESAVLRTQWSVLGELVSATRDAAFRRQAPQHRPPKHRAPPPTGGDALFDVDDAPRSNGTWTTALLAQKSTARASRVSSNRSNHSNNDSTADAAGTIVLFTEGSGKQAALPHATAELLGRGFGSAGTQSGEVTLRIRRGRATGAAGGDTGSNDTNNADPPNSNESHCERRLPVDVESDATAAAIDALLRADDAAAADVLARGYVDHSCLPLSAALSASDGNEANPPVHGLLRAALGLDEDLHSGILIPNAAGDNNADARHHPPPTCCLEHFAATHIGQRPGPGHF